MTSSPCSRSSARRSSIPFRTSGSWPSQLVHLADDAQRMAGAVGLRGVAGEPLVGHVRVVLEGTQGLHDVDVSPLLAPGQRSRQLRSPGGCVHERGEVDVVRHPALLEVGAVAGNQLIADLEHGLRPVVEGPADVLAASRRSRGRSCCCLPPSPSPRFPSTNARSGSARRGLGFPRDDQFVALAEPLQVPSEHVLHALQGLRIGA